MRNKTLLIITAITLASALPLSSPGSGIPVIDLSNLTQNITTALHQVMSYAQQVEQYQKQISQYELQIQQFQNQVKNTVTFPTQLYQDANQTINSVMGVAKILQTGTQLQSTLSQFQNVNYWLSGSHSPYQYQMTGLTNQVQANASMVNGIVAQQTKMQQDAQTLQSLQSQAKSADGAMKALSAANQFAGMMQNQLLSIRGLLLSGQQVVAAQNTTTSNSQSMQQAATQQFYGTQIAPQPHTGYQP